MTKDEFIAEYCKRSGIALDELSRYRVALPCACGDELCEGWAMIRNDPLSIQEHAEATIFQQKAELDRLSAIVKEWQLDGVKPFKVYKAPLTAPLYINGGDIATVEFRVEDKVIGHSVVPDAPTGIYDHAVAFVFTDAFGMKTGFGGAIGRKERC